MSPTPTKAKVKKKIQITNPQGFMQVYQIWFMREGINMSMEDLEKVHKKMITYCEKVVNKDGEQIQSAYVKYIDDVTAKWYEKETLSVLMDKLRKIQTRAKYSEKDSRYGRGPQMVPVADG